MSKNSLNVPASGSVTMTRPPGLATRANSRDRRAPDRRTPASAGVAQHQIVDVVGERQLRRRASRRKKMRLPASRPALARASSSIGDDGVDGDDAPLLRPSSTGSRARDSRCRSRRRAPSPWAAAPDRAASACRSAATRWAGSPRRRPWRACPFGCDRFIVDLLALGGFQPLTGPGRRCSPAYRPPTILHGHEVERARQAVHRQLQIRALVGRRKRG